MRIPIAQGEKLTLEQNRELRRLFRDIQSCANEGIISFDRAKSGLQRIIVEAHQSTELLVINFDIPASEPGLVIKEEDQIKSRLRGKWTFNPDELSLYLSKEQHVGRSVLGMSLIKDFTGRAVAGDQLLDFFLSNPHLIPVEWEKEETVEFWGTIYHSPNGDLGVRHLYRRDDGKKWGSGLSWLGLQFHGKRPALLIKVG